MAKRKKAAKRRHAKTTPLHVWTDGIEGDPCPLAQSSVAGRAGRRLMLADGLCAAGLEHKQCQCLIGFGHNATVLCGHVGAVSDFHERRLAHD
jgi:hypothetical protein